MKMMKIHIFIFILPPCRQECCMCVKVLSVVFFLVSSLNALPDFARSLWRVAKGNMSNGAHTARPHAHSTSSFESTKSAAQNTEKILHNTQPHSHHKRVKHQSWLIPLPLCSSIGIISTAERIIQWHQVGKLFLVTFSDIDPPTYF